MNIIQKWESIIKNSRQRKKLKRFYRHIEEYCEEQITGSERHIKSLKEKVVDGTEKMDDILLEVDLQKISDSESSRKYAEEIIETLDKKQKEIENLEEQIKDFEFTIERRKSQLELLKKEYSDEEDFESVK